MAPPKALIMDDDNEFRMLLHEFLLDIGLAVMSASSVAEALDMAQSETPDVILLDVALPDGSGIDVCRMLKSIERLKHVPILFLSARAGLNDKLLGYLAGAMKYITKPCDFTDIENSIRSAIPFHEMFQTMKNTLPDDTLQYCSWEE